MKELRDSEVQGTRSEEYTYVKVVTELVWRSGISEYGKAEVGILG